MTDKPRKILIIGAEVNTRSMLLALKAKLPDVEVEHVFLDDIPERRSQPGERMIIIDEAEQIPTSKTVSALIKRSQHLFSAEADMREFYASQRYQKPVRLRGAAQHKRQARKNKGKRK